MNESEEQLSSKTTVILIGTEKKINNVNLY